MNGATGAIEGTPTTAGSYYWVLKVTDSKGGIAAMPVTIKVGPPVITASPAGPSLPDATQGVPYTVKFTVTGGTAPYTGQCLSSCPPGLSFGQSSDYTGAPTTAGSFTFNIKFRDRNGNESAPYTYTLLVKAQAGIVGDLMPGSINENYLGQLEVVGLKEDFTIVSATGMPPGLSARKSGTIRIWVEGRPTAAGQFNINLKLQDSAGTKAERAIPLMIAAANPLNLLPDSMLPQATVGTPYTVLIRTGSGKAPITISVASGTLPAGLGLVPQSYGADLTGTPAVEGNYRFTLGATDGDNRTGTREYLLKIVRNGLTISPATMPDGAVGKAYTVQFQAAGGKAPYSFARVLGDALGMSLDQYSGSFSGTPTKAGSFLQRIRATDADGLIIGEQSYTWKVTGVNVVLSPSKLPSLVLGEPYSVQLTAAGGTAPYRFAFAATPCLPLGLTLSPAGLISGTPENQGPSGCMIQAQDNEGNKGQAYYDLTYTPRQGIFLNPVTLPPATAGVAYHATIFAEQTRAAVSFRVESGALPAGFQFGATTGNMAGLSGVAEQAGTYTFRIAVVESGTGRTASREYTLTVVAPALQIQPATLPEVEGEKAFSIQLTAQGGTPPYVFEAVGALPVGVEFSSNGLIGGTPRGYGAFPLFVKVRDSKGTLASRNYQLKVQGGGLILSSESLPNARIRVAYAHQFRASGSTLPLTFSLLSGQLPKGLSLAANGVLGGTPEQAGAFYFTVSVRDPEGRTGSWSYSVLVEGATLVMGPAALPPLTPNQPYSADLTVQGGKAPYVWALKYSPNMPPTLKVNSDGRINGTAAQGSVTISMTIEVKDADGSTGLKIYELKVLDDAALNIQPATLPNPTVGALYQQQLTLVGGKAPVSFKPVSGIMPYGFKLSAGGFIEARPENPGPVSFDIQAQDGSGRTVTRLYQLNVEASAELRLLPESLPSGKKGQAYSAQFSMSGGRAPYRFVVTAGSLPLGWGLTAEGLLSGVAAQVGRATFTVQGSDANGRSLQRSYEVQVAEDVTLQLMPASLSGSKVGESYRAQLSMVGGSPPYRYAVIAGALPRGWTVSADGLISGTAEKAGTESFRMEGRDAANLTAVREYTVQVTDATRIGLQPGALDAGFIGESYRVQFTMTGGTPPYRFALAGGALPRGFTLSAEGLLSGVAAQAQTAVFQVRGTDAGGNSESREYRLELKPRQLSIQPGRLPDAVLGSAYQQRLSCEGVAGCKFNLAAGSLLPAGLQLSEDGELRGIPVSAGRFEFTVKATGPSGGQGERRYEMAVTPGELTLLPESLPPAGLGRPYLIALTAAGGVAPLKIAAAGLPEGLRLDASGVLSGSAEKEGEVSIQFVVSDASGMTRQFIRKLLVDGQPLEIQTTWLEKTRQGAAYAAQFRARGGMGVYRWQIEQGGVRGLALENSGRLSGRAEEPGVFELQVLVQDESGRSQRKRLNLTVDPGAQAGNRLFVWPSEIEFVVRQGEPGGRGCVSVFSTGAPMGFTAGYRMAGGDWIKWGEVDKGTPGTVCVVADLSKLKPGEWRGDLELKGDEPGVGLRVPVTAVVRAAPAPAVNAMPRELWQAADVQTRFSTNRLMLANEGADRQDVQLKKGPESWLRLGETEVNLGSGEVRQVELEFDSAGLDPGLYESSILAGEQEIRVRFLVGRGGGWAVTEPVVQVHLREGEAVPQVRYVRARNMLATAAGLKWGVLEDGSLPDWLKVNGGDHPADPGAEAKLELTFQGAGRRAGEYECLLYIDGKPVSVRMIVYGEGDAIPEMEPGVVDLAQGEAEIRLSTDVRDVLVSTGDGGKWLNVEKGERSLKLRASAAGMTAGVYWGRVTAASESGIVLAQSVRFRVGGENREAAGCAPRLEVLSPPDGFRKQTGEMIAVRVKSDGCVQGVVARLGEQTMSLEKGGEDEWSGTIIPAQAEEQGVLEVMAHGQAVAVHGRVTQDDESRPVVKSLKTAAGLEGPAVAGNWLILQGSGLAQGGAVADNDSDLPETLAGAQVWLGEHRLKIKEAAPERLRVWAPESAEGAARHWLTVRSGAKVSLAARTALVDSHPQLHSMNEQGTGAAWALIEATGDLITKASPAKAGERVVVAASGLSAGPVEVEVQGQSAGDVEVKAEGMGLWTIRFRLPSTVSGGVELRIRQGSRVSPPLTMETR